jgi:hypothetical protein
METQPAGEQPKQRSRFFKYLRRTLLTLFFLLISLVGTGVLLAYIYEDEIKQLALKQLEKHLNTELIIDPQNIEFSVLRDFPYASLEFNDIKALDAIVSQKKDTLFEAGRVSFQFNIVDLFHKNYHIKKISIQDVQLKLWVNKKGKDNYHFLKESKDTSSAGFAFALEKIVLSNIDVSYLDHRDASDHSFTVKEAALKGNFSSDNYTLETDGNIFIDHLRTDSTTWVSGNPLDVQLVLAVDNRTKTYTISSSELKLSDLGFSVAGNVRDEGKTMRVDMEMKGKDIDIRSLLSLLPGRYNEKVKNYESSGTMYLTTTIKGQAGEGMYPVVNAEFGIDKGEITQVSSKVTLKNVNLKGSFTNGYVEKKDRNYLEIEQFSAGVVEGHIDGRIRISNFDDPVVNASANANIDLADLQKFLAIDTIESLSGQLKLNASFNGKIKDPKNYLEDDFKDSKTTGLMTVKNAALRLKNNNLKFDSLDAGFVFENNDIQVNNFSGNISGNDFALKGYFRNMLAWIFLDDQDLTVDAMFRSRNIDLEAFLKDKTEESAQAADYKVRFSEHVNFNLTTEIDRLKFKRFEASNIRGVLSLKDRQLTADPLTMETMNGNIKMSGMVDGTREDNLAITCDVSVRKISITKMFYEMENFGQEYLTDKNLRGTASGDIQFASVCTPALEIDPGKIYARSNIRIEQGELIKFQPLKDITEYIRKDKTLFFLKVDELEKKLDDVKFATLENTVEIRDQVITIPDMVIKSSAMDIDFSGTHSFKGDVNYKFAFIIRELLIRPDKENEKRNTEFGVVEDDGHYQFPLRLLMTGTVDKIEIKRDKQAIKEKRKEDIRKEKENLKNILREEFGWFRKDSTTAKPDKKDEKFNIKWDDEKKNDKKKKDDENLEGDDF